MKKVVWIDGGIGRVICSIPAIDKLSEKEDVIVVTPWKEIFFNKQNIKRLYKPDSEYLWEDVISQNELIHTEPYWDFDYYKNKMHLIQSFNKLINKEITKEIPKPKIEFNSIEIKFAKDFIKEIKSKTNKKIMIIQPFGSTGKYVDEDILDESNRSLNIKTIEKIIEEFKKDYVFIYVGTEPIPKYKVYPQIHMMNRQQKQQINKNSIVIEIPQRLGLRGIFAIIKESDVILSCDSFTQHLGYAFGIPTIVFIGGTDERNICYLDKHLILKKNNYPKEYNPFRIPNNNHMIVANDGAMNFTDDELNDFIQKIKKYLEVKK